MAQDQSTTETFSIVFDGGLAERGELHFYEYGRAAYAAARLVNTIEHFRRTGRVPKRISNRNYVDLKIKAPEKGSFPLDILIPLAIEAHKIIVEYDIPVTEFVKYIIHLIKRIIPEREDKIIALAKIDLDRERERTAQSAEETKRIQAIRDMVHSSNINTNAAIDVLQRTITAVDTRIPQIADQREIKEILSELLEAKAREESFD
ncbi:MAG: hypothetical protein P4L81_00105, partial [Candidatus Pacebacteria bacterium]|nr:hypothetical protein [Candidatus Paceibacterota bacterium]